MEFEQYKKKVKNKYDLFIENNFNIDEIVVCYRKKRDAICAICKKDLENYQDLIVRYIVEKNKI